MPQVAELPDRNVTVVHRTNETVAIGGHEVPRRFSAEYEPADRSFTARLAVEVDLSGRAEVVALQVDYRPPPGERAVSSRSVRSLKLGEVLRIVVGAAADLPPPSGPAGPPTREADLTSEQREFAEKVGMSPAEYARWIMPKRPSAAEAADRFVEGYRPERMGPRTPHRGKPVSDEDLRRVAEVYRSVTKGGIETVAAELNYSRSTAARHIREARRRGILEPRFATGKPRRTSPKEDR